MKKETGSGVDGVYPRVTKIICTDREKGIFMVTFIPSEGEKETTWGLLADDELHCFQRIQEEFKRRENKDEPDVLFTKWVTPPLKFAEVPLRWMDRHPEVIKAGLQAKHIVDAL